MSSEDGNRRGLTDGWHVINVTVWLISAGTDVLSADSHENVAILNLPPTR